VTVDVDGEARIAERVAARGPRDQLVRQAVRAALVALIDRELEAALERLGSSDEGGRGRRTRPPSDSCVARSRA
jgi:hypothetical protein